MRIKGTHRVEDMSNILTFRHSSFSSVEFSWPVGQTLLGFLKGLGEEAAVMLTDVIGREWVLIPETVEIELVENPPQPDESGLYDSVMDEAMAVLSNGYVPAGYFAHPIGQGDMDIYIKKDMAIPGNRHFVLKVLCDIVDLLDAGEKLGS